MSNRETLNSPAAENPEADMLENLDLLLDIEAVEDESDWTTIENLDAVQSEVLDEK